MNEYSYILEPYKSSRNRYRCPACGKAHQFTRYINTGTGEYLAENVGKCNRVQKCSYHRTPKKHFGDNNGLNLPEKRRFAPSKPSAQKTAPKEVDFLLGSILAESLQREDQNNGFLIFLRSLFGEQVAALLKGEYNIGTHERDYTRTDFFQVDIEGRFRQAKNMGYNPSTGKKRDVYFSYTKSKYPELNLVQCFFGEHLLRKYPSKRVAIVESEKTAIISSVYLPEFLWLAAGNANGLNREKTEVLTGRKVILYPDLGQFDYWKKKIDDLNPKAVFSISKILGDRATDQEKGKGLDLADYLIRIAPPLGEYPHGNIEQPEPEQESESLEHFEPLDQFENTSRIHSFAELYPAEVAEMNAFFEGRQLHQVELGLDCRVEDPALFVESHLRIINRGRGERMTRPYFERLVRFREALEGAILN